MNRQKRILILGAGLLQRPALEIARKKDWYIVVADGNPNAPYISLADAFEHVDLKDKEGMAEVALAHQVDGVFTAGTDFSSTVAWAAEKAGLPGIGYEAALRATDKGLMRQAFSLKGVPSPRFAVLEQGDPLPDDFDFPLVIKPVDNMGARGIRRIDTSHELERAVPGALALSRRGQVIIEEYIEGPEYSLDAIVEDGSVTVCGFADRHICFAPYFVEMGHTMPTSVTAADRKAVIRAFEQGIQAIGIRNGAAKGDIKMGKNGPVIGEIAARLSGGYMSGWTYPYSSGVEVTEAALNIAVGLKAGNLSPVKTLTVAERAWISIPGIIQSRSGVEEAGSIPGVKDVFSRYQPGDQVVFPVNNVQKCGNVIAAAQTRSEAAAAADRARSRVFIRLKPDEESTRRFLSDKPGWIPDAFRLSCSANGSALEQMPSYQIPSDYSRPSDLSCGLPLSVLSLPNRTAENGIDWNGRSFSDSLDFLEKERFIRFTTTEERTQQPGDHDILLGALFWNLFLRGGVQSIVWFADTLKNRRTFKSIREFLDSWSKSD